MDRVVFLDRSDIKAVPEPVLELLKPRKMEWSRTRGIIISDCCEMQAMESGTPTSLLNCANESESGRYARTSTSVQDQSYRL